MKTSAIFQVIVVVLLVVIIGLLTLRPTPSRYELRENFLIDTATGATYIHTADGKAKAEWRKVNAGVD